MPLREKLNEMKADSHMTIQQIADKSGVPVSTVTRIISGTTDNPSFAAVKEIVVAMGGSLDYLAGIISNRDSELAETTRVLEEKSRILQEREKTMQGMQELLDKKDYWLRRISTFASVITFILIAFLAIFLIIDFTDPTRGFFYLDPDFEKVFAWFGKTSEFSGEVFQSTLRILK